MSRFAHIQLDELHQEHRNAARHLVREVEKFIEGFPPGREKSLALTALEDVDHRIGKMLRDNQLAEEKHRNELAAKDDLTP